MQLDQGRKNKKGFNQKAKEASEFKQVNMFNFSQHLRAILTLLIISIILNLTGFLNFMISTEASSSGRLQNEHSIGVNIEPIQPLSRLFQTEKPTIDSTVNFKNALTSTDDPLKSVAEFMDSNYLSTGLLDAHISQSPDLMIINPEDSDTSLLPEKFDASNKHQRLSDNSHQHNVADWWTKLSHKSKNSTEQHGMRARKRNLNKQQVTKTSVYKEQPLNQNAIITMRNQLIAIKSKHKVLVTKSMRQLQQLDNRLIDSYKLCFKKNMPLYAGMLYRTRDFVARLAKDVKHEKKVLEAMTKQVQGVLKQRLTNKTLVKEYNYLTDVTTEMTNLHEQESNSFEDLRQILTKKVTPIQKSVKRDNSMQLTEVSQPVQDISETLDSHDQLNKDRNKFWQQHSGRKKSSAKTSTNKPIEQEKLDSTPKKATKTIRYTVSINEVNFKKELSKSQNLIDRINNSCHELTSVVDDIIYLFKLSDYPQTGKKGSSSSKTNKLYNSQSKDLPNAQANNGFSLAEQKRAKKMLKSPVRVFLERFGKLTSANLENSNISNSITNSEMNATLPEIKPIFEPANLIYTDPLSDPELGFDDSLTPTTTTQIPTTVADGK